MPLPGRRGPRFPKNRPTTGEEPGATGAAASFRRKIPVSRAPGGPGGAEEFLTSCFQQLRNYFAHDIVQRALSAIAAGQRRNRSVARSLLQAAATRSSVPVRLMRTRAAPASP